MDVAITYRQSAREANQLVEQIQGMGRRALAIPVEFSQHEAAGTVFDAYSAVFDNCYALINNASEFTPSPFGQLTGEQLDRQLAINARTPLFIIQKFTAMLSSHQSPGRIVNFIDIHVMGEPLKGYLAYNVSKAMLQEATMTLAMELAPQVTVNAVAPGVVAWADSYSPAQQEQYMKRVPLGRSGTPEDAAAAALFLVRDADYCTGQIIKLDGGRALT